MRCTGCFKEFKEDDKAYATVVGSIDRNPILHDALGFHMDDLCRDCGMALHNDFIAGMLQAKYLKISKESARKK